MLQRYERSHPVANDEALVQYEALHSCLPDLLTWAPAAVGRNANPTLYSIYHRLTDLLYELDYDEREVVRQQIDYVYMFHTITDLDVYPDSFTLHCNISGVDRSMTVAIFTKMDMDSED